MVAARVRRGRYERRRRWHSRAGVRSRRRLSSLPRPSARSPSCVRLGPHRSQIRVSDPCRPSRTAVAHVPTMGARWRRDRESDPQPLIEGLRRSSLAPLARHPWIPGNPRLAERLTAPRVFRLLCLSRARRTTCSMTRRGRAHLPRQARRAVRRSRPWSAERTCLDSGTRSAPHR